MQVNNDPVQPLNKPCIRDMHELVTHVLPKIMPEPLLQLAPMCELERRAHEIVVEHPRFREELPLVLAGEQRRRQRLGGLLQLPTYQAVQQHA